MSNRTVVQRPSKNGTLFRKKVIREILQVPEEYRNRKIVTDWIAATPNGHFKHQLLGKYFTEMEMMDAGLDPRVSRIYGKGEDKGVLTYICLSTIDVGGNDSLVEKTGVYGFISIKISFFSKHI